MRDCLCADAQAEPIHASRRRAKIPSPFNPLPFCPPARAEWAGRAVLKNELRLAHPPTARNKNELPSRSF